jgi:hypothetical protein
MAVGDAEDWVIDWKKLGWQKKKKKKKKGGGQGSAEKRDRITIHFIYRSCFTSVKHVY